MKFHCDRCKTRYSISDDRVRGKILKIRCKSCSSVITVHEGMQPALRSRSQPAALITKPDPVRSRRESALSGAFQEAMGKSAPSPSDSLPAAPAPSEAEWYVSIDGDQTGPLSPDEAVGWVRDRAPSDELYCWTEGFDDWQSVDEVSHFKDVRAEFEQSFDDSERTVVSTNPIIHDDAARPVPLSAPTVPETPQPLFAGVMAAVEASAPTAIHEPGTSKDDLIKMPPTGAAAQQRPAAANNKPAEREAKELELDIGEASRVVKLPMLARMAGRAQTAPIHAGAGAQGASDRIGDGSGAFSSVQPAIVSGETPPPQVVAALKRRSLVVPILVVGVVLIGGVGALLYTAFGDSEPEDERIARGSISSQNLAHRYADPITKRVEVQVPAKPEPGKQPTVAKSGPRKSRNGSHSATAALPPPRREGANEVAIGRREDPIVQGYLSPDVVESKYNKHLVLVQRCYNRALKADPFLKVPKTRVSITISPQGRVQKVAIPTLSGQELGTCLSRLMRRWRFKKSTKGLNTVLYVVFRS